MLQNKDQISNNTAQDRVGPAQAASAMTPWARLFSVIVVVSVLLPTVPLPGLGRDTASAAEQIENAEPITDTIPTRVSTGPVGLGPESRGFTSVSVDAAGLCLSMLTARGDIWIHRDDSGIASFDCRIAEGRELSSLIAGTAPDPDVHLLSAAGDNFVALVYSDSGQGRWQFTESGQVMTYGDAEFFGDLHSLGIAPTKPVVAAVVLRDGSGYWLVAADGGVFAFGEARFFGSLPGTLVSLGLSPTDLAAPIVAMTVSNDGAGYLLYGADGGVFAFGTAEFRGSLPGLGSDATASTADIIGAVGWATQPGYTLVSSTGQTVNFGGPDMGDLSDLDLAEPIVAVAATPDDRSMLMIDASGRLYPFGTSFVCRSVSPGECAIDTPSGEWTSIEIAGIQVSESRFDLVFVPATRQLRSCTELRAFAKLTESTLVVDLQQRPTDTPCTAALDLSGDDFTTLVHLERPLPEDVAVVFEPTALGVPFEGTFSEIDLLRRRRSQNGLRTTSLEAELLLADPDFAANWDANVSLTDNELAGNTPFYLIQLLQTYDEVVQTTLEAIGLSRFFIQTRELDGRLFVRLLDSPDPAVDLAAVVADAFAVDRVCVRYLYDDCVATASTHFLSQITVEIVGLDASTSVCRDIDRLQLTEPQLNWAETADALSRVLGSLSIRLRDRTFDQQEAGPILTAGADVVDSLIVPRLWDGTPPWADSPAINEALDLATTFAAEGCNPPSAAGVGLTCNGQVVTSPDQQWPYGELFDSLGFEWPEDLDAATKLLDAVACDDREFLRTNGYLVPTNLALTGVIYLSILGQMPRSITGQPAPTADRVISATGQDVTAFATPFIETYGMSPEQALRSLVLQTVYNTFGPLLAENFSSRPDSATWWIDYENDSRMVLASTTDEGLLAAKELLADTGLDFSVIRVRFTDLELRQAVSGIIEGLFADILDDTVELNRRLGQATFASNIQNSEVVVTLSPFAPDDIRDLVVRLVDMYEPARLVIG